MLVGLIGAGNMARALARGWGDPVVCHDPVSERAEALATEVGGEAVASNAAVAERADVVVLCHKPPQLEPVARVLRGTAKAVVSILGGTPLERVKAAYPDTPVVRVMPSVPVEIRRGVVCHAADPDGDGEVTRAVLELFGRVARVVTVDDKLMDVATGLMSCAPAYVALSVEAQVDAGVRHGMPAEVAAELVVGALAGSAELIQARGNDTLALRREVTSPGGMTARGLRALEEHGLRDAYQAALDAVLATGTPSK